MVGKLQAVVSAIAPRVQRGGISAHDFELRIDRVLVNSGELQKYASQVSAVDGRWQAKPMRRNRIRMPACLATKTSFPRPWRGGRLFRCRAWDIAGKASAGHGPALPVVVTPLPSRALH